MKPFALFLLSFLAFACAALLSGCAMNGTAVDPVSSTKVSLGAVQGSNYGGHAPLVGAHVFVLEGYQSSAGSSPNVGWYQPAKSLLTASYNTAGAANGEVYPTAVETANDATNGDYYVTTDSFGDFGLSGDYTCDSGYPVYLYASGGNPETIPPINITQVQIAGTGPYTLTFTNSGTNLLYQGEQVTLTGFSGSWAYLNGSTQVVLANSSLTITTFQVSVGSNGGNTTGTYTVAGTATQVVPIVNNPAVVNLAVLGVCGDNGTLNFSSLSYVYMNEVSTAAAAYALGGYFPTASGGGSSQNAGLVTLAYPGAAAANLSVPAGDSAALTGIQIAARNAAQLYDIQGSNVGTGGDGDTHIARSTTPGIPFTATATYGSPVLTDVSYTGNLFVGAAVYGQGIPAGTVVSSIVATGIPATNVVTLNNSVTYGTVTNPVTAGVTITPQGNGSVPQALLDTVGNILANCVDSANTAGSASPQCTALFSNTLSAGTTGTRPIDTATAAIDIAKNPWANTGTLVSSPTGNAPFQPSATGANDLAVGITYNYGEFSGTTLTETASVDKSGNVYVTTFIPGGLAILTPQGSVTTTLAGTIETGSFYTAFDSSGNAWTSNELTSPADLYEYTGLPVPLIYNNLLNSPATEGENYYVAINASDDVYTAAYENNAVFEYQAPLLVPANTYTASGCTTNVRGLALDASQNLWVANFSSYLKNGPGTGTLQGAICMFPYVTASQALSTTVAFTDGNSNLLAPYAMAIDPNGAAWVVLQGATGTAALAKITYTPATSPFYTDAYYGGGGLDVPSGLAIDPAGLVFVSNDGGSSKSLSVFTNAGTPLSDGENGLTGGYISGGVPSSSLTSPRNPAIDAAGNLWVPNGQADTITEFLGIATPVLTPLSAALHKGSSSVIVKP